jgi:hypothetical protein
MRDFSPLWELQSHVSRSLVNKCLKTCPLDNMDRYKFQICYCISCRYFNFLDCTLSPSNFNQFPSSVFSELHLSSRMFASGTPSCHIYNADLIRIDFMYKNTQLFLLLVLCTHYSLYLVLDYTQYNQLRAFTFNLLSFLFTSSTHVTNLPIFTN